MSNKATDTRRMAKKAGAIAASGLLLASLPSLSGCSAIQGAFGGGEPTNARGTVNTLATLSQRTFQLEKNAVNDMCNGGLKLTYLDMQRRPMSTFAGQELSSAGLSGTENDGDVSELQTNDIAIQVDVSFTWNVNTYIDTTTAVLGESADIPSTLGEILQPGVLMYVQGEDADGNEYLSGDIIHVEEEENSPLATSSSWNYDILDTLLPETSVTSQGSFLIRVASTARNLTLYIVTPVGGQNIDPEEIFNRSVDIYELPLT